MRTIPSAVRTALVTSIAALSLTASLPAQNASSSDLDALREQIRLLDQKLRALERNQELKEETAAAAAKKLPTVTAGASGFGITSSDKAFDLKLKALAQFDARFFLDDNNGERDTFLLRRIRTIFAGTVGGIYDFNITPELATGTNNSTSVGLWDAFIAARFSPSFGIRAGKFPSAVGLEPGANRHFIESPFVNTLLPNRDIGIETFGSLSAFDYRLGVFNGAANNTANFGGGAPDIGDGDKTLAGRLTFAPFKSKKDSAISKLSLGIGGSTGNERGTAGTNLSNGLSNISSNSQQAIFSYGGTLRGNGTHNRISPSIEWYTGGPFSFVAEYALEQQDVAVNAAGLTRKFQNDAWRVTAGYVLTGEEATKAGVTPTAPFSWEGGTWGAFEVVARVSGLNLDNDLFDTVAAGGAGLSDVNNASGAIAYGVGLNWYLNRNVRWLFNVERTDYEGASGGNVAATQVGARTDELAFITRIQLQF
ncbi:MAG: porin [Rariglobus sp.]